MRTVPFSATPKLRALVLITRKDDTVIRLAQSMMPVVEGGNTWTPVPGMALSDFTERNDGTIPSTSLTVTMTRSGTFDPVEVDSGLFEEASVKIYLIDVSQSVASPDLKFQIFDGSMLGDVQYGIDRSASFDIVGKFAIPRDIFVRKYTLECDADFGDARRCKIPTFPNQDITSNDLHDVARLETLAVGDRRKFRYASAGNPSDYHNVYWEVTSITTGITGGSSPSSPSDTVGATVTDGGVTFTVRNAWARSFQVASVIDEKHITITVTEPRSSAITSWFAPGRIVMASGFCKNKVSRIDAWDGTSQIDLVDPIANYLSVGDWGEIAPDCDKTLDMCVDKYSNANNYRGFPHITGSRLATSTFIPGTTVVPGPTDDPGSSGGGSSGYSAEAVEFLGGSS